MQSGYSRERIIKTILERSGILNVEVVDTTLKEDKSCVIRSSANCYIGIDMSQISSTAELRCLLYHELGHIATNSFYTTDTLRCDQKKAERSAERWAVTHCVPFDELVASLMNGVSNVYQLSEYFDITIDAATVVLDYYKSKIMEYIQLFYGVSENEEAV